MRAMRLGFAEMHDVASSEGQTIPRSLLDYASKWAETKYE
jgi:hypothetical protein